MHEGIRGYYKAKKAFYDDAFENQMKYSTSSYLERKEEMEINDNYMN